MSSRVSCVRTEDDMCHSVSSKDDKFKKYMTDSSMDIVDDCCHSPEVDYDEGDCFSVFY